MTRKDAIFREKEGILGVKLEPLFFLFEVPFIAVKNSRPATPPSSLKIGRLTHKKKFPLLKEIGDHVCAAAVATAAVYVQIIEVLNEA